MAKMMLLAKSSSPSTLDTSYLLSFEVCSGDGFMDLSEHSGGVAEEKVASLKLSLMHGLALASVLPTPLTTFLMCVYIP